MIGLKSEKMQKIGFLIDHICFYFRTNQIMLTSVKKLGFKLKELDFVRHAIFPKVKVPHFFNFC
jgi:hypothetical protein